MQKLTLTVLAGLCTTLLYAAPSIEKKEEKFDRKGTPVLVTRHTVNLGNGKINYHTVTNPNDNKPVQQEWGGFQIRHRILEEPQYSRKLESRQFPCRDRQGRQNTAGPESRGKN